MQGTKISEFQVIFSFRELAWFGISGMREM
jgi:hypothetical protein